MSYYDKAKDIYDMSAKGKGLEAFEKYYHNDVVMVEATGEARNGKAANRKFEQEFIGMIKEVHGSGVRAITSNESIVKRFSKFVKFSARSTLFSKSNL